MKTLKDFKYGDVMSIGKFIDAVHVKGFTNYDGYGYYVFGKNDYVLDYMQVYPSFVLENKLFTRYSRIIWFNK